jgi:hypothetical protein
MAAIHPYRQGFSPPAFSRAGSCSLWCTSRHSQVCSSRSRCSGRQAWVQCPPIWLCSNTIHSRRYHRRLAEQQPRGPFGRTVLIVGWEWSPSRSRCGKYLPFRRPPTTPAGNCSLRSSSAAWTAGYSSLRTRISSSPRLTGPMPAWQAASSALCSASEARSASQSSEQCCLAPSRSTSLAAMPSRLAFGHGATLAIAVSAGLAAAAFGLVFGLPRRSWGSQQRPRGTVREREHQLDCYGGAGLSPSGPAVTLRSYPGEIATGTGAGHART